MSAVGDLVARVVSGDVRSAARACRFVDERASNHRELLGELHTHGGRAWILGVTGNPGAGKSTLVDRLIARFRSLEKRVAVVAIDPTSPFSGGAILGDRIRMQRHFDDAGVFIRSLATRGALGGLSRSAADVVRVLDAWGADVVLVETVGVGQDEIEITRAAHTTLVVAAPGLGDDVQAIKAGLLECADVFAVNKADRDGADQTVRDLGLMIALGGEMLHAGVHSRRHSAGSLDISKEVVEHPRETWTPPVVKCVATDDQGTEELVRELERHREWLETTDAGRARNEHRVAEALRAFLRDVLADEVVRSLGPAVDAAALRVEAREIDPYAACDELISQYRNR